MVGRWPWFEAPNVQPLANVAGRRQSNVAPLHPERTLPPNRHTKVGQAPFPRGTARSCFGDAAPLFANLALGTGLDAPATHTVSSTLCDKSAGEALLSVQSFLGVDHLRRTSQTRSGPSGRPHVPVQGLELGETPYPQRVYAWLDCQREFGAAVRSTVGQTKVPSCPHELSRRLHPLPAPAARPHGSCEGLYLGETT